MKVRCGLMLSPQRHKKSRWFENHLLSKALVSDKITFPRLCIMNWRYG